jgi:hypothetical protein
MKLNQKLQKFMLHVFLSFSPQFLKGDRLSSLWQFVSHPEEEY